MKAAALLAGLLVSKPKMQEVLGQPAEFAAFIRSEIAKWGKVAKEANIKIDQ